MSSDQGDADPGGSTAGAGPSAATDGAVTRVLVIGAGAVGSFLGGMLATAGHDLTLLGRRPFAGPGDAGTLLLEEADGSVRTVDVRRAHDAATIEDPALIIVAVKSFDLEAALAVAERWPTADVMTVQNGIGAEEMAVAARTSAVIAGSLTSAVEPIAAGVRRRRVGGIGLAVARGDASTTALVARLAEAWTGSGLPATVFDDATAMKWSKLLANLVGNATSAILDMSPGEIYADHRTYPIERRQLQEAVAVMRAMGTRPVALPGAHVRLLLWGIALPEVIGRPIVARSIAGARGGKSPSLRLHVRGGGSGPTEARWLNGAVARAGSGLAVPTPVNQLLAELTEEVASDPERAAWFAGRPDRLAAHVAGIGAGS